MESFLFEYFFYSNLRFKFLKNSALYISCCIRYIKDTILKAIYNPLACTIHRLLLYSVYQRYNFESNLQHVKCWADLEDGCIRYIKDTILKAIYNTQAYGEKPQTLYSVYQRYNFESNLQHCVPPFLLIHSCIRYIKDTILKAIYNAFSIAANSNRAVFGISKIQF